MKCQVLDAKWEDLSSETSSSSKKRARRPVRRQVEATSKRARRHLNSDGDDLDDFLASEDTTDEDVQDRPGSDSDEFELGDARLRQSDSMQRATFPELTSLILLVGPSGSGKTCAIKAVVEELGWDIFEVFAGMGTRSAKNLERWVGDVGRNHTVRKNGDFFNVKAKEADSSPQKATGEPKKVRQSVIVLEEVDLLYREEKDFWAGKSLPFSSSLICFSRATIL